MNLPKIGEPVTITNPETKEARVGKVAAIKGHKIKVEFQDKSWMIIELNAPN